VGMAFPSGDGSAARRPGTRRVLYVDPDEQRAGPAVDALASAGFTVERIGDPASVRDRLDDIDCLVSEQDLPGTSGLDLLRELRANGSEIPFVLYTGTGDEHLASEAISAGVTDYVPRDPPAKQRAVLIDCLEAATDDPDRRFGTVTETLKDRAMDEAPVGITIADARRRDVPLIYANDAFEELTEFSETEALGRNCDFLQGNDSDEEAITEMARAIDAEEATSVELRNYTKSGEEFWNRVDIAPVHGDDGELTHYVGFQTDVTDRVEAEQEARAQAEKATAERQKVETLLERLDGLVTDVTGQLLGAGTRSAVERGVCERLVETEEYAVAWIGERDPATDSVTPSTWAGIDEAPVGAIEFGTDDPVARAVETGEIQVESDALPSPHGALEGVATGLAAVPLGSDDVQYGVLVVYVRDGRSLGDHERTVLSAVGRSTATALNALTSQRLLSSDEVMELEFELTGDPPVVVGLSEALGATFAHAGTVTREDGPTTLFFETDADPEAVAATLAERDSPVESTTVTDGDDIAVIELTVEESPLVRVLLDRGGRITDLTATDGTGDLTVEVTPDARPRAVIEAIEDRLGDADLAAYRELDRPAATHQDIRTSIQERLTDRQATALRKAFVAGFFEWPHQSTGEELADSMGIDRSTFHQHLRAAQRKVFEELYD